MRFAGQSVLLRNLSRNVVCSFNRVGYFKTVSLNPHYHCYHYVSALPESKPFLKSDRERYDPGDLLKANCTLPASRPSAKFSFTINDIPVSLVDIYENLHKNRAFFSSTNTDEK